MRELPDNNLAYPVFILLDTGKCGSGFFISHNNGLYLVTAKHVILDSDNQFKGQESFKISAYSSDHSIKEPMIISVDYTKLKKEVKFHPVFDVLVMRIGQDKEKKSDGTKGDFLDGVKLESQPDSFELVWIADHKFKKYEDVLVSNDVYVFGYPISIGKKTYEQIDPARPLLRKGIVAGKNEKKRTIIIDSPVYFGNSGGLVVEVHTNEQGVKVFLPIGIVSEYIPFIEELFNSQHNEVTAVNIQNSGYSVVVPIDTMLDILE